MKKWKRMAASLLCAVLLLGALGTSIAKADEASLDVGENIEKIAYFDFDTDSGTTVTSSVGQYQGTLSVSKSGKAEITETEGLGGSKAVSLERGAPNPDGGYIDLPAAAFQAAGNEVTLSLWLKLSDNPNWTQILTVGTDNAHYAVFAACGNPYGNPVGLTMALKNGGEEYRIAADASLALPVGEWVMVTYTQQNNTAALYLNGEPIPTTFYNTTMEVVTGENPMPIGLSDIASLQGAKVQLGRSCVEFADNALSGTVDNLLLCKGAMSEQEVQAYYQQQLTSVLEQSIAKLKTDLAAQFDGKDVSASLELPLQGEFGTTIQWTSDHPEYLASDGTLLKRPTEQDVQVKLTAKIENGEIQESLTVTVTLPVYSLDQQLEDDLAWASKYLDFIVNDTQTVLPGQAPNGADLEWSVKSGHAEIKDRTIYKTEQAAENEAIVLLVTAKLGELSKQTEVSGLILKDPYVAQVMSYFTNSDDTRGMKLSYSYDLKNFMPLNNGKAVVKMETGSKRMRDPSIFRLKDGTFGVVSTQGWDNPAIYFVDSPDLCTFTNERLVKVADGVRAWAPECNYDRITGQYYVYWSDPNRDGGYIRYNTTTDLVNFSEEQCYIRLDHQLIDASIKWAEGKYYMAIKSEGGSVSYGTILMASADTLAGPWESSGTFIAGTDAGYPWCEGPTWSKSYADGKYYLYFDEVGGRDVIYASNADISNDAGWVYKADGDGQVASQKIKQNIDDADKRTSHCGLIDVTQKELDRLIETWGVTSSDYGIAFEVLEIEAPAQLQVLEGTGMDDIDLPETVRVKYDDGGWRDVAVSWDTTPYQPTEGTYTLSGTIALAEDVKNSQNIAVELTILVEREVHDLVFVPAKESTCVEQGSVAHWHCNSCNLNYADQDATEVLADVTTPINPDNHKNVKLVGWLPATTVHEGYTGDQVCQDCGKTISKGKVIPKKTGAAPVDPEPTEPAKHEDYTDVHVGDWYYDAVAYVSEHGLMDGVGSGKFNPEGAVTRAMVWTVLARMAGEDTDGGSTWYSKAQEWVMETGVSDGSNPMASITREQLAAMLYRYAGSPAVTGSLSAYPDAGEVSDWAVDAMVWATEEGIINGMGGKLSPKTGATRAQLAAMLMRLEQNVL